MSFDYSALAQTVVDLINEFGRPVTILRYDQAAADPTKPWAGPADPRATPNFQLNTVGVYVSVGGAEKYGFMITDQDLIPRVKEVLLIPPQIGGTEDLSTMNEVVDGGVRYNVVTADKLRPGDTTMLYYLAVGR